MNVLGGLAEEQLLTRIPTASLDETVRGARKRILDPKQKWESLNYIYLLSSSGLIRGVISIKELLQAPANKKLKEWTRKDIVSVRAHTPLRVAAGRAVMHNIKSIPVLDTRKHFIGVVGTDTILDVLEQEHVRDLLTASGVPAEQQTFANVLNAKISQLIRWRTPWLLIGIIGGMLTSTIVEVYETQLVEVIELAFFIPIILYMGAAVGTQTQMLFIRGISFQQIKLREYLAKEIVIDIFIGVILALGFGLYTFATTDSLLITSIVATAIFIIISTAGLIAVLISLLFIKLKQDPAIGGGPFATIAQDIASLLIYLSVAASFLLL